MYLNQLFIIYFPFFFPFFFFLYFIWSFDGDASSYGQAQLIAVLYLLKDIEHTG
jgi:hypothetical protein